MLDTVVTIERRKLTVVGARARCIVLCHLAAYQTDAASELLPIDLLTAECNYLASSMMLMMHQSLQLALAAPLLYFPQVQPHSISNRLTRTARMAISLQAALARSPRAARARLAVSCRCQANSDRHSNPITCGPGSTQRFPI